MVIGIKKNRIGINLAYILLFIAISIVCAVMWGMYQGNYTNEYWIKNGVEVEAECISYKRRIDENDMHLVVFWCTYEYVDSDKRTIIINASRASKPP